MSADAVSAAESFVYAALKASPAILAALPRGNGEVRVYPEVAPVGVEDTHIAHDLAGGGDVARPMGAPTMWTLPWDITAWINRSSRQPLGPLMADALAALCGDDLGGRKHPPHDDGDGGRWRVSASYVGPVPAPGDYQSSGVWRRVTHRVVLELSPYPSG